MPIPDKQNKKITDDLPSIISRQVILRVAIGAFFREIHCADELGSGMRKLMRYGKVYDGADPEMVEGDIFRTSVAVPDFAGHGREDHGDAKDTAPVVTPEVRRMLSFMTREMTRAEIQEALGLKDVKPIRRVSARGGARHMNLYRHCGSLLHAGVS